MSASPSPKLSAQASVGLPLATKACYASRSSCIVAHGQIPPTLAISPTTCRSSAASCSARKRGTQQPATAGAQSGDRIVRLWGNQRLSQVEFEQVSAAVGRERQP